MVKLKYAFHNVMLSTRVFIFLQYLLVDVLRTLDIVLQRPVAARIVSLIALSTVAIWANSVVPDRVRSARQLFYSSALILLRLQSSVSTGRVCVLWRGGG